MSKKIITNREKTILILILTFRFLNSKQIQQFLSHKDHRRINSWLRDLVERQYLERDFRKVFGAKPAVYSLSLKGRKYIRETYSLVSKKYLRRLKEDRKRSKGFRIKCQIVADFYLTLFVNQIKEFPQILEKFLTERHIKYKMNQFFFSTPAFYENLIFKLLPKLKPDAYFSVKRRDGINHSMIYVLDAYIPRLMLRYTLKNIFTTLEDEYWEDDEISSLHFYFVCPNNMVVVYLRRLLLSFLERYYGEKPVIFHFATRNKLYENRNEKSKEMKWINISSTD